MNETHVIETHGLGRRFGRREAVRDLSIAVPRGSIYAFLGPNGAGKTTTIQMLMNLREPTAGEARVLGTDCRQLGPRELARIGYVSENQRLPEWMTVGQMLAYCEPFYPTWDRAFCARLLGEFGLPADQKIRHLSRGTKMKAALLASLAYRPELLILDEPFSGLDPLVRDEFIRGVLELTEQENWTVFLSSHDIDEVERLADHVGVIHEGYLRVNESTEALARRFRQVEVVFPSPAPPEPPRPAPTGWLGLETAGHTWRFVDSAFDPAAGEAGLRAHLPADARLTLTPLSLREIFLTLARQFRPTPAA